MKIFVFIFTDICDYNDIIVKVFASCKEEAIDIMKQDLTISKYFNIKKLKFEGLQYVIELDRPKII